MKILMPLLLLSGSCLAQQTVTSVANGLASNPFVWSCSCIPATNAHVTISHHITMNSDWLVNNGGSITVTSTGSFNQDANRAILIDGAGSLFTVQGTSIFENFAFTNGAGGSNSGTFTVNTALYYEAGTNFTNSGSMPGIDSLETQGTFTNTGSIAAGNFLNTGTFNLDGGVVTADSLGTTGSYLVTNGVTYASAFGNMGIVSIPVGGAPIYIAYDGYNTGEIHLASGTVVTVGASFYTGDLQNHDALLEVNGLMTVNNDFATSDALQGSGMLCVGQGTSNSGSVSGTLNFCDNTGEGTFDLNIGTIAPTVVYCTPGCFLSIPENEKTTISFAPNPATSTIQLTGDGVNRAAIYSSTGELMLNITDGFDKIDVSRLGAGMYVLLIETQNETKSEKLIIE